MARGSGARRRRGNHLGRQFRVRRRGQPHHHRRHAARRDHHSGGFLGPARMVCCGGRVVRAHLAHVAKQVLGLPDTLHPATYLSILYLALFTLVVAASALHAACWSTHSPRARKETEAVMKRTRATANRRATSIH
ncbi:MAG: hypothetical protein MZW92_52780 [Comamonadaceae bacterium]|nr:hypothetical protein [Comamonadaceae bacterium]